MKYLLITSILVLGTISVSVAQFVGPPTFDPDVLDNPIDGGLGLLLGAGAAYGAKKLRDYRNNSRKEDSEE